MLETTDSLLTLTNPKVLTVGFDLDSLDELSRLLTTLGAETAARVPVQVRKIHPATYLGEGKIGEIKETVARAQASAVVVDVELSPNQLKNLEKAIGIPVIDRPGVIIEIFSRHARSKEAKNQVALARLQYLLPRLAHFWNHFERQRGGGATSRGMGEKQVEVDRRLVKDRIHLLKQRLKSIAQERDLQRKGRKNVFKVALVGYTNAGKSTLLNALTHSAVRAEDKLFATLDAAVRTLDPHSHPPIVMIDTVGFISNLPTFLVASFRSTLEEVREADLLLHVVDGSAEQAREQFEVTEKVLEELGVGDKPKIVVMNKTDLLPDPAARNRARAVVRGAVQVSALREEDVAKLRIQVLDYFRSQMAVWEVMIPYNESKLEAQLHAHGAVEVKRHLEKGTFYRIRMDEHWAQKLQLERYRLGRESA